jgi:hypothetical protein
MTTPRTFSLTLRAAVAATWFSGQTAKTWIAIPGVNTVNDAWAGQSTLTVYGNPPGICRAWNGACVDQVRGEYLFVANGGHEDYAGNEVYALGLRQATPKWYRLLDHSPSSVINSYVHSGSGAPPASTSSTAAGQGVNPDKYAAMYGDGRMRSVHGWYSTHFANNKAWLVTQGSPTGVGYSTPHAWSFDRGFVGLATAFGQTPLAWANNAGPWQWLGFSATGGMSTTAQGIPAWDDSPAVALDEVTGILHTLHGSDQGDGQVSGYGTLNTSTGAFTHTASAIGQTAWGAAVVAYDPQWDGVLGDPNGTCRWRLFIALNKTGGLYVRDLVAGTWSTPALSSSTFSASGVGAVYHSASRSMIAADPVRSGNGTVYKIRVPTNPTTGVYVPSATWAVTPITTVGGANPSTGSAAGLGGGYSYGKLRLVKNIPDGNDGIVLCTETANPTYVYKLPLTEIQN